MPSLLSSSDHQSSPLRYTALAEAQEYPVMIRSLLVDLGKCFDHLVAENGELAEEIARLRSSTKLGKKQIITLDDELELWDEANSAVVPHGEMCGVPRSPTSWPSPANVQDSQVLPVQQFLLQGHNGEPSTSRPRHAELAEYEHDEPYSTLNERQSTYSSLTRSAAMPGTLSREKSKSDDSSEASSGSAMMDRTMTTETKKSEWITGSKATISTVTGSKISADNYSNVLPRWLQKLPASTKPRNTKFPDQGSMALDTLHAQQSASSSRNYYMLEPAGRIRLTWDACWCTVLIFEVWSTPIKLVYLEDEWMPDWWRTLQIISLTFFILDIGLNFFTGFVHVALNETIMDQSHVVRHYLQHWFLIDMVATIPWDWLTTSEVVARNKGLKMLRMLKFLRAAKLSRIINSSKEAKETFSISSVRHRRKRQSSLESAPFWSMLHGIISSEMLGLVLKWLAVILILAHLHAIVWTCLQEEWSATRDTQLGFHRYLQSFWWAFCSFTFGGTYIATDPAMWCLDMIILFERLILCTLIGKSVVLKAILASESSSKIDLKSREALQYMEEHDISLKTELQVLKTWTETAKEQKRRRWFSELMNTSVPEELKHRINDELWSDKLRSLGLIEHCVKLHGDFALQLSQIVVEDTYSSGVVVCKDGDPAKTAHHVITGNLVVFTSEYDFVRPFTAGMWIGEKALVNSELRRYGSVIAKALSTLLTIPGAAYFQLMVDLGIDEKFKEFCSRELWKGLCGRCGAVGDHWAEDCPGHGGPSLKSGPSKSVGEALMFGMSFSRSHQSQHMSSVGPVKMQSDLKMYTKHHKMEHLNEALEKMMIVNLTNLEDRYQEAQDGLIRMGIDLSEEELDLLSAREIRFFRSKALAQTRALLARGATSGNHFIFLSHYKMEAGTEAALMRSELEALIKEDRQHPANEISNPVYLDSEDLVDLNKLMDEVSSSHNLVVMLTKDILTRPWCLLEIATAWRDNVPVIPVNILKTGCEFAFPDENFYEELTNGTILGSKGLDLIQEYGFDMDDVVSSCKEVFKRIAVPYSPHRPLSIRKVELQELLKQANMREFEHAPVDRVARGTVIPKKADAMVKSKKSKSVSARLGNGVNALRRMSKIFLNFE